MSDKDLLHTPQIQAMQVLDSIEAPVVAWNRDARIVYCNQAGSKLLGQDAALQPGAQPTDLSDSAALAVLGVPLETVFTTQSPHRYDRLVATARGERWYRCTASPMLSTTGDVEHVVVVSHDIHEDVTARLRVEAAEARLLRMTEGVNLPMGRWNRQIQLTFFNKPYLTWSERTAESLQSKTLTEIFGHDAWMQARRSFQKAFDGEQACYERIIVLPQNREKWIRVFVFPDTLPDGRIEEIYTIAVDIDVEKRLSRELTEKIKRLDVFTANIPFPLTYFDRNFIYQFVNKAFADRHWLDVGMVIGQTIEAIRGPAAWTEYKQYAEEALAGKEVKYERLMQTRNGVERWVRTHYIPDRNEQGDVLGVYTATTDIHDLKLSEIALQRAARHDPLTGLLNRRAVYSGIDDVLNRGYNTSAIDAIGRCHALLAIDLDGYTDLSANHGVAMVDAMIVHIGRQLVQSFSRAEVVLGRTGGDEFTVLVELERGVHTSEAAIEEASRALAAIGAYFSHEGMSLPMSCSVGIAIAPLHATEAMQLVRCAQQALRDAKRGGRAQVRIAQSSLN